MENYGDRPEIAEPEVEVPPAPAHARRASRRARTTIEPPVPAELEEHYVPPVPPPLPKPPPARLLAWIGLFGVPTFVLVALVARLELPSWLGLLLMVWFVGGFVFLVASMRPGPGGLRRRGEALGAPHPSTQSLEERVAHSEIVEIRGHLIDTATLSRVLNDVDEYGGDYVVERFDIGHGSDDPSYARIDVSAESEETLQRILMRLQIHGVNQVDPGEAEVDVAEQDGVFPDGFYSSTNLETQVRLDGHWVRVLNPEMDCGLVVDAGEQWRRAGDGGTELTVRTLPMSDVRAGMRIVCGASGIKVTVPISTKSDDSLRLHGLRRLE